MIEPHFLEAISDGRFAFGYPLGWWGLLLIAVLVFAIALFSYWKTTRPIGWAWKTALTGLRGFSLLLLAFLLLDPGVLVPEVVPQETYVGVLVDDSQSMGISDRSNAPTRHQQVVDALYKDEKIIERLGENFQVRSYRFSDVAQRYSGANGLTQAGVETSLFTSVQQVLAEMSAFPLAGLVVVSDGADNSVAENLAALEELNGFEVPIFTVGVGAESIDKDLAIIDVSINESLLENSLYTVQVAFSQQGFNGQASRLSIVTENGDVVADKTVNLGEPGSVSRETLEIKPSQENILVYTVQLEDKSQETIVKNNQFTFFIDNRPKPTLDVLYIEGQPRNEYKFIQRALQGDESLRLATYLQTGPRKFLRQGINNPSELETGFPKTPEELYEYEAVIFGNVARSFFNEQQLGLLQEFVAARGGGFLALGELDEAFISTPVADILPLEMQRRARLPSYLQGGTRRGDHPTGAEFPVRLTRDGEYSPILRLLADDRANRQRWSVMPDLEGVYVTGRPKPGASVLIEHPSLTYQNAALPILATQRYGSGRSMMLTTASSWRWQMLQSHEDQTHEQLWRQMSRWLTKEAKTRVSVSLDRDNYHAGDTVKVAATFLDEEYQPDNNALLWLEITKPDGSSEEFAMEWDIEKDGVYTRQLTVDAEGVYDLKVKVPSAAEALQAFSPILVTPSRREFLDPARDSGVLQRMAANTKGRYYDIEGAGRMVADISYNPNAYSKQSRQSFWDQPIFLFILLASLALEWLGRRYKGLS